MSSSAREHTRILDVRRLTKGPAEGQSLAEWWESERSKQTPEAAAIEEAADLLRTSDNPVAFPTETVYGLGADATRSVAVKGIYRVKQRPSDNPLIVHVDSLAMLARLLNPNSASERKGHVSVAFNSKQDIPSVYLPLIERFWPGPLTIILPNPTGSCLAKEVTSHLSTFGARMPASPLARLLIHVTDRPLAAPSANASTKPSPTTAQHVYHDLHQRIELILDGGQTGVGVESTVVDGLADPPVILRPGGIGVDQIQSCPGFEHVRTSYDDGNGHDHKEAPRAPGMKYRHYSPRARVVLFEAGSNEEAVAARLWKDLEDTAVGARTVGIVRTRNWKPGLGILADEELKAKATPVQSSIEGLTRFPVDLVVVSGGGNGNGGGSSPPTGGTVKTKSIYDYSLGADVESIARGLFSTLRAFDDEEVDVVFVEGIDDSEGGLAAAIMNRLRKAAGADEKAV